MSFLNFALPIFLALGFIFLIVGHSFYVYSGKKPALQARGVFFMIWGLIIVSLVTLVTVIAY